MDVRKSSMYILITMLCVNAWSMMLSEVGIQVGLPSDLIDPEEFLDNTDVEGVADTWQWDVEFSDIAFGTIRFLTTAVGLINGFPRLLSQAEVPSFIVNPLSIVWYFMFFTTVVLYYIGGRDT